MTCLVAPASQMLSGVHNPVDQAFLCCVRLSALSPGRPMQPQQGSIACARHALMPCMLRAAVDVGRTLKARSAVIREVHDSLHELGVYAPDASSDGKALLER